MKIRSISSALLCLLAAATAYGGDPESKRRTWCDVGGSWFAAADSAPWTASFTETSFAGGLVITQWTGGDGDWDGYCAGSVRNTNGVGSWTRKGPRSILYTIITFSLDADGDVVCIWKASGRIQLDTACQSGRQSGSIEFFDPGMDPFADEPFQYFPREGETEFVRMTVDPCRE